MIVLGIDPGTKNTALCAVDTGRGRPIWLADAVAAPAEAWPELEELLGSCRPDLVVIECSEALHEGNLGNKSVLGTVRLAGEFRGFCREAGYRSEYITPAQVRMSLIGRSPKGSNQDAAIKRVLGATVLDLPRTNCHVRDACAAAIVGASIFSRKRVA